MFYYLLFIMWCWRHGLSVWRHYEDTISARCDKSVSTHPVCPYMLPGRKTPNTQPVCAGFCGFGWYQIKLVMTNSCHCGELVGWWVGGLMGWLVGWLVGWWVGELVSWLAGWWREWSIIVMVLLCWCEGFILICQNINHGIFPRSLHHIMEGSRPSSPHDSFTKLS